MREHAEDTRWLWKIQKKFVLDCRYLEQIGRSIYTANGLSASSLRSAIKLLTLYKYKKLHFASRATHHVKRDLILPADIFVRSVLEKQSLNSLRLVMNLGLTSVDM
jgi:hypothetical protein